MLRVGHVQPRPEGVQFVLQVQDSRRGEEAAGECCGHGRGQSTALSDRGTELLRLLLRLVAVLLQFLQGRALLLQDHLKLLLAEVLQLAHAVLEGGEEHLQRVLTRTVDS